ncbi:hypothetical protein ACHAXA_005205 [Cyclostephanos tholiformis]|uniref:Uncharacterized protein n=1 Tax=Cyclostephanos tholiformis TaxID=382380 RepID=A0ABD3SF01_9STRA
MPYRCNLTYEELLSCVKVLGDDIGDPPTFSKHQNPAPPVVVNAKHTPEKFCSRNDTDAFSPQSDNVQNNSQFRQQSKTSGTTKSEQEENRKDENISEKKDDLIARLLKPHKRKILIMHTRWNEYVPKVPSCNATLMVALLLNHIPGTRDSRNEKRKANGTDRRDRSGFYDGRAGVKQLLQGDPALPPETCGRAVAHALHILAHREGICNCPKEF